MKMNVLLGAIALGAFATPALAQEPLDGYFQVNLGAGVAGDVELDATVPPDTFSGELDLEVGVFASAVAGFNAGDNFAYEIEALVTANDVDTEEADAVFGAPLDASVTSYAALANVIYKFQASGFTPYVGAGLGFGKTEVEALGGSDDDIGVAWQLKAGVVFPVSESLTLDAGYRYLTLPQYDVSEGGDSLQVDTTAHVVSIGARFGF